MNPSDLTSTGWRGTNQGVQLRVGGNSRMEIPFGGTANAFFNGVAAYSHTFTEVGTNCHLLTSTGSSGSGIEQRWIRELSLVEDGIQRIMFNVETAPGFNISRWGYSVRCVKNP